VRRAAQLSILTALFACKADAPPALIVDISSELAIPEETNGLAVRVRADGEDRIESTYELGTPPRDRWPQSLPIVAGDDAPERVTVAAELRVEQEGRPSVIVGYGDIDEPFPTAGETHVGLFVERACVDADDDGYGVGFGCALPDCDDADPDAPSIYFCGEKPPPDGGIPEDDGGTPRDGGPAPRDGGVGQQMCDSDICEADEVCFAGMCMKRCTSSEDCGELHLSCLTRYGVCICRVPCRGGTDCGPLECTDGCCQF
jgi:hypothetical protein